MKKFKDTAIAHSRPTLGMEESRAVSAVIKSGHVAAGKAVVSFENAAAEFVGVRHAVAVSSGSAALHLALIALGIPENCDIILPSYCCSALLNAVKYINCRPAPADTGRNSFNITPETVKKAVTAKPRAIIAPHMFGSPSDIAGIVKCGLPVIEDCAMSLGASVNGRKTGSFSEIGIVSFYATKMICTGYGGMIFTNSSALASTIRDIINYDNRRNYIVRYNYLMNDMQAVMGTEQLKKLGGFIAKRVHIANLYSEILGGLPLDLPEIKKGCVFHRYVIRLKTGVSVEKMVNYLKNRGIEAKRPVFKPLHRYLGLPAQRFPNTEYIYAKSLSLPIYPLLDDKSVSRIACAVKNAML